MGAERHVPIRHAKARLAALRRKANAERAAHVAREQAQRVCSPGGLAAIFPGLSVKRQP